MFDERKSCFYGTSLFFRYDDEEDPNFDFTLRKKSTKLLLNTFFSNLLIEEEEEVQNGRIVWAQYDMILLPIFVPCDERKGSISSWSIDRMEFLNQSFWYLLDLVQRGKFMRLCETYSGFFGGVFGLGDFCGEERKKKKGGRDLMRKERERERVMKRCFLFVVMRKGKRES